MADELMDYDEAVRRYDPVVGLEVHVELSTATKMFDAAPNAFGGEPNSRVTPTSVGLPGSLPVVNARGVEYAIRIGLALGCEIARSCRFARKNYFGDIVQFERIGFARLDEIKDDELIFYFAHK